MNDLPGLLPGIWVEHEHNSDVDISCIGPRQLTSRQSVHRKVGANNDQPVKSPCLVSALPMSALGP